MRGEVERLREVGDIGAIGVSYLFSFVNPDHELRTRELIAEVWPEVQVSLSHEVLPRWREYERTSTTVLDAYLKPLMHSYMRAAGAGVRRGRHRPAARPALQRRRMSPAKAKEQPIALVRSGPSGGIMASGTLGRRLGLGDLSPATWAARRFEACLLPGSEPAFTNLEELEYGVPIALTMVDARAIGAGGGSLAWVDAAGILKVGPRSAGADPGPACYGRGGTQATVTDANVVLGRLAPEFLLAGDLELGVEAAQTALDELAGTLGLSRDRVAQGIVDVANSNMAQALRLVSTDRGYDPRGSTLVAYGGAGPLHACELARALQMPRVLVPLYPGAFSAFGALLADTRFDYTQTRWMRMSHLDVEAVAEVFGAPRGAGRVTTSAPRASPRCRSSCAPSTCATSGRTGSSNVPMPGGELTADDFAAATGLFEREHERFYGYSIPGEELEMLTFNVAAVGTRHAIELPRIEPGGTPEPMLRRPVTFGVEDGPVETPVYRRDDFGAGAEIAGPAVIGQTDATTLLPPGSSAKVDDLGNLIITV